MAGRTSHPEGDWNIMKRTYSAFASSKTRLFAGAGLAALSFVAFASPAYSQDEDTEPDTQAEEEADTNIGEAIVVTGSRIRRGAFSGAEPITVISSEEITLAGFNSATEALQSSTITQGGGQINDYYSGFVTDGGPGANTIGLRNLDPSRTLVLLNGHRLSPAGSRGSVGSADLNVLPTAILDRVEVLKAGASSVYGSDAVAGVINIITDDQFDGFTVEAQTNVPEEGDGITSRLAGTFGYSSDRFRVIGSVEYYKREGLRLNERDWANCPIEGLLDGEGGGRGSGDYIDPTTGEAKCFTIFNGGVTINTLGLPETEGVDRDTGELGTFTRFVPSDNTSTFPGYSGVGLYNRDSYDPESQEEYLISPAEIYTGFLQAGYDIGVLGDAEAYIELLGNQRKSSSVSYRQLSLDYIQGSPLLPESIRDGVFLSPNETSSGNNVAARAFTGFGLLENKEQVDFVRLAGGLRGDFAFDGWRYDLYVSKSFSDATYESESFLTDRIANSLDVVDNGDGTFSCATQADVNCVAAPELSADVLAGNYSDEYRDYIVDNTVGTTKFRETIYSFTVDGPVTELPGGQAQLALGVEYRTNSIDDQPSEDSVNGNLYNLTSSAPTVGSDSVWETFGEVYLPLLSDVPGVHRLNLTASGRYTDYESYGGDFTYKVAAEWAPLRGIAFRGSYGTSYRAPALFEQFLGATSGFLASTNDPCSLYLESTDAFVATNCAAEGFADDFQQNSAVEVITVGGAETGLAAETSTNLNLGVVIDPLLPESLGSFTVALDYFDIKISDGVARIGAINILDLCYNSANFDLDSGFCTFVERDASNALTVRDSYINLATDIRRGFELNVRYSNDIGPGTLTFNALVTKYEEQSGRLFETDALVDLNNSLNNPEWVGDFNLSYAIDNVTVRYGLEWIGAITGTNEYYATDTTTGEINEATLEVLEDFYDLNVGDYFIHDLSVQFNAGDFQLTAGVQNLLDREPPEVTAGVYNTVVNSPLYSGYDYRGRTFFVNTTFNF